MRKILAGVIAGIAAVGLTWTNMSHASASALPPSTTVLAQMKTVNDYWASHASLGTAGWQSATYYEGALAYYGVSHDPRALSRTEAWASAHGYRLDGGPTTRNADAQAAGKVYLDLYSLLGGKGKVSQISASLKAMVASKQRTDWSWIDAVFMSMPAFVHYGVLTHNDSYLRAAYQLFHYPKNTLGLVTPGKLFYRDAAGKRYGQLWSRGNGWAIASQAEVLTYLPHSDPLAAESIRTLRDMAARLKVYQRSDGFWPVDLANRSSAAESSGTALDTYALAYGVRTGILDRATYLPIITRAWSALNCAVDANGRLGQVQGVARAPGPVVATNTEDYAVGAFLLAGSEIARLR